MSFDVIGRGRYATDLEDDSKVTHVDFISSGALSVVNNFTN